MAEKEEQKEKKGLSRNLMAMKFMQRQQEAELRMKLEADQRQQIDESHWVVEGLEQDAFPTVSSMNESTFDFSLGRRSFSEFNPRIEKLEVDTYGEPEGFREPKKRKQKHRKVNHHHDDDADISSLQMSEKLTSFKRKRDQLDPPTMGLPAPPEDNSTNYYNRNRKSKKAIKKKY